MRLTVTVNNKPFKESQLYHNIKFMLVIIILISIVISDVVAISLSVEYLNFNNWVFLYLIFTIIKGVWITEAMLNNKG